MGRPRSTADLVLHPVRIRVLQTLLGGRALTTTQIAAELPDVPTATLYRHVGVLASSGVLDVVGEQRVRGAVERTYVLRSEATQVAEEDLAAMSPGEHKHAFAAFVAGLLASFDAYVDGGDVDLVRDGVGYRHHGLWLTDDELSEMLETMRAALRRAAAYEPAPGRTRRVLSTVIVPDRSAHEPPES